MNASYSKTAADVIEALVANGMTHHEVSVVCKFAADVITAIEAAGGDPTELFSEDQDKVANVLLDAIAGAGGKALDGIWGFGTRMAEKGVDAGIKYAPLTIGAGLAVPALAGYAAGHGMGTLTDQPEETVKSIQQRELVALLEENARAARQQQQIEEGRTALTPRRKRRRIA